jgi:hypothetical protein
VLNERLPVFLIGAGRSGTKFLRSCLAASEDVDIIPYDINYVWRYGNETLSHDEFKPTDVTPNIANYIKNILPTLSNTQKLTARFLVEKSVPNTLRVSFINEVFPEAKFIHIVRDGRAVIESSVRQWKEPVSKVYLFQKLKYFPWRNYRYAYWFVCNLIKSKLFNQPPIWGPRYEGIEEDVSLLSVEEVCAKQWSRCVDVVGKQLKELDQNRVLIISFESLMSKPSVIKDLCEFVGINDIENVEQYFLAHVDRSNNDKSIGRLTPDAINAIDKYAKDSLIRLGYK